MALYTGKGDAGTTKLFDSPSGVRVRKDDPIFEALGTSDELNTIIGWAKVEARRTKMDCLGRPMAGLLHEVQDALFTAQAELAGAPKHIPEQSVKDMETLIHFIEQVLPPITSFLVPGGTELSARLDIARTLARRVERRVVTVHESDTRAVSEHTRRYLNRLSSLLFALGRYVNYRSGIEELPPVYKANG
jgi:cob(I)alamin adenosyltransferase